MRTPEQIVNAEVHYCVSHLVSTLANAYGTANHAQSNTELDETIEQAFELTSPIDDWEEAALQAGWRASKPGAGLRKTGTARPDMPSGDYARNWRHACEIDDIEPYQREVFEHWIISDWLADQLEARGEKVDRDFAGMTVWARTTSGQGIASDSVIVAIADDLNRVNG